MPDLCSTCQPGAKTVEDEPFGCPFTDKLIVGQCGFYVGFKVNGWYEIIKLIYSNKECVDMESASKSNCNNH